MSVSTVAEMSSATVFPSDLGWMGLRFQGDKVSRLVFGHDHKSKTWAGLDLRDDFAHDSNLSFAQQRIVALLVDYASGKGPDLSQIEIDPGPATPFQTRVWLACREIPAGETISYGQLARVVGNPGAARAVGSFMAKNRIPLLIPCHRVMGSSGKLHGFSAPQGLTMKQRLLQLEVVGRET
jgi:methylated-DNA-[protein]-cysteine S-methyltransferase